MNQGNILKLECLPHHPTSLTNNHGVLEKEVLTHTGGEGDNENIERKRLSCRQSH